MAPPSASTFLDEMSLADPANRWIAGHLAQGFDAMGEQKRLAPHTGGRQSSLGPGVTPTDDESRQNCLGIALSRPSEGAE
jgi:hypothetical protein